MNNFVIWLRDILQVYYKGVFNVLPLRRLQFLSFFQIRSAECKVDRHFSPEIQRVCAFSV